MSNINSCRFRVISIIRIACSAVGLLRRLALTKPGVKPLAAKAGCLVCVGLFWFGTPVLRADTHYVRTPETCTNTDLQSPYTNWDTAATQIQWAVSAAGSDDTVLISNGVYYLTNQISLSGNLTVQSVNGPGATIIDGNYPFFSNRCFYVGTGTKIISGLTISNCYKADSGGGGIYVDSGNAVITNCVFTTNRCNTGGGAIYISGSAVGTGLIADCVFSNNQAATRGGGLYLEIVTNNVVVQNCSFVGNVVTSTVSGYGGGGIGTHPYATNTMIRGCLIKNNTVWRQGGGLLIYAGIVSNCTIINNVIGTNTYDSGGGGVWMKTAGIVCNCIITGNVNWSSGTYGGGGGVYMESTTGALQNCLIAGNAASNAAGGIYVYLDSNVTIDNCTIVSNRAVVNGGGMRTQQGSNWVYVRNCIIASNSAPSNPDLHAYNTNACAFCCSPTHGSFAPSQGNITNDPRFADPVSGNWRLNANSPCINTGTNRSWMTNGVDLDGRIRIRYGTVDMGAYEFIHHATIYQVR